MELSVNHSLCVVHFISEAVKRCDREDLRLVIVTDQPAHPWSRQSSHHCKAHPRSAGATLQVDED